MAGPADIFTSVIAFAFALGFIGLIIFRFFGKYLPVPYRLRVPPFQTGVVLLHDKPERLVAPGTYWLTPRRTILTCDTRQTPYKTQTEEYLTGDNFGLRITLTGHYRITDPAAFVTSSSNATGTFFLELTQATRNAVAELSGHNLTFARETLPARIQQLAAPKTTKAGIIADTIEITDFVPLGWLKVTLPQVPLPPTTQGYGPN